MQGERLSCARARGGVVVAPEHQAAQAGLSVLMDGGSAIEAAVATAAALGATYPHMTGIGGDAFWLVHRPGEAPVAVMGCGGAGSGATLERYAGLRSVPVRGALAANTVAGAVSSWQAALALPGASRLGLHRVLRDAIAFAGDGVALAPSLALAIAAKRGELSAIDGWADAFDNGRGLLRQPGLAETLERLCAHGLGAMYEGPLADDIAADLADAGAPVTGHDLRAHLATVEKPLRVMLKCGEVLSSPPPTQGFASLLILALAARLPESDPESAARLHGIVEATKAAFAIRNREVFDPGAMTFDCQRLLDDEAALDRMAAGIDARRASPWPRSGGPGDTTWIGAADREGCVVSMIQSIYFEFGSGLVLPRTGIVWQNRGSSFRLATEGWNVLAPGRKPFHTLNPSLARLNDGRVMAYGCMGGEGQPQTQAAVFVRHVHDGIGLAEAIAAPRWLLGRTWGDDSTALRLESRIDAKVIDGLREAGHPVVMVDGFSELMGHAGAIVRHADGALDGASDPRSDGEAAWF